MNSVTEQLRSNNTFKLRKLFWIDIALLFSLFVNNVESGETQSKLRQHQIEISGFKFIPKELKVYTGDTITWINKDIVPHNIIDSSDQKIISPELASGEAYIFVVKTPMLYECGLHPSMKGKISLADSPHNEINMKID